MKDRSKKYQFRWSEVKGKTTQMIENINLEQSL